MLFELLRDSEPMVEESADSGASSRQPAPSSELGGTAELPVARMPGTRPAPSPFGTEYR